MHNRVRGSSKNRIIRQKRTYHAMGRAKKRLDLSLTERDLAEITAIIQNGESTPIEKLTNSKCVHRLNWRGREFDVVYSKAAKQVLTFVENHRVGSASEN